MESVGNKIKFLHIRYEDLMNQSNFDFMTTEVVTIPRDLRSSAYLRLQELSVPCWCSEDGHLRVEINSLVVALQLRSVVQQITAPRRLLVDWLEKCWQVEE